MKGTNHETERDEMPLEVFPPGTTPDIEVFDIGVPVRIGCKGEEIQGVITEISITNGYRILYRVSWWNGREHKNEYLEAYEIVSESPKVRIGFTR